MRKSVGAWYRDSLKAKIFNENSRQFDEIEFIFFEQKKDFLNFIWSNRIDVVVIEIDQYSALDSIVPFIRMVFKQLPIICLLRDEHLDPIDFIKAGADYALSPSIAQALQIVIQRCLERVSLPEESGVDCINLAGWKLDYLHGELILPDQQTLKLTSLERNLLKIFFENAEQECGFEFIAAQMGIGPDEPYRHRLEVSIGRLRQKFRQHFCRDIPIFSVRGFGYVFTPKRNKGDFVRPVEYGYDDIEKKMIANT